MPVIAIDIVGIGTKWLGKGLGGKNVLTSVKMARGSALGRGSDLSSE